MTAQEQTPAFAAGLKQTRKAVRDGTAKGVLLAKNADPALTEPLEALCASRSIPVHWVSTMHQLGAACHLTVGAAAAAVFRENLVLTE